MNIFALSNNPRLAAQYHCDKHLSKMLLESVQMLSTTRAVLGLSHPYRKTHQNHPCTIWVRQSLSNYLWLVELAYALEEERQYRFGPKPRHKSICILDKMPVPSAKHLPDIGRTKFAQAMPWFLVTSNPVSAYRDYYHTKTFAKWTRRPKPTWYLF